MSATSELRSDTNIVREPGPGALDVLDAEKFFTSA
jgi:hypothetical protein